MNAESARGFLVIRYLFVLSMIFIVLLPLTTRSQEEVGSVATTSELALMPEQSEPQSIEATSTATSTAEVVGAPPTEIAAVLGATTDTLVGLPNSLAEEIVGDFVESEETPAPIQIDVPFTSPLFKREFKKHVAIDSAAAHSCEAGTFTVLLTDKQSAKSNLTLWRPDDTAYEVEIGALPSGIDIKFSKNASYKYALGLSDRTLELRFENQFGSQKGSFSVPIIFTKKDGTNSSVVCQINIINR